MGVRGGESQPGAAVQQGDGAGGPAWVECYRWREGVVGTGEPLAEEDVARAVQHDEIGEAIPVDIREQRRVAKLDPGGLGDRLEGTIASSQQHRGRPVVV